MCMTDGLHLSGKGQQSSLRICSDPLTVEQVATVSTRFAVGLEKKPNTGGIIKDSTQKSAKNSLENSSEFDYRCGC